MIRVGIADELESFFHVLVYYALRYVKSANCSGFSVANFLDRYFDLYGYEDSLYTCGDTKRSTIELGMLRIGSKTHIHFDNPLDDLFAQLLSWFQARYIVLAKKRRSAPLARNAAASSSSGLKPPAGVSRALAGRPAIQLPPNAVRPPSEEQITLAQSVESHDSIVVALGTAIYAQWPKQKAEDQIPSGWKPMSGHFPERLSRNVENKRKRLNMAASEPLLPGHLVAARPPWTPQKY